VTGCCIYFDFSRVGYLKRQKPISTTSGMCYCHLLHTVTLFQMSVRTIARYCTSDVYDTSKTPNVSPVRQPSSDCFCGFTSTVPTLAFGCLCETRCTERRMIFFYREKLTRWFIIIFPAIFLRFELLCPTLRFIDWLSTFFWALPRNFMGNVCLDSN